MSDQISESTNNSGDPDFNSSVSETTDSIISESSETGVSQESGQTESNGNPAWNELLSAVPQEFHSHLKAGFGEWDKGVQNRFQKVQQDYAPLKQYEEFSKLGVAPTDINEAMQIRHAMQNDPASLYKWLQDSYNLGQASQGQEETEELELSETDAFFKDPRYTELKSQADFAANAIKQFNQQAVTNKVSAEIETETKAVQEKFPGLDISAVATFALGMSKNDNSMPDLMKAAERMAGFVPNAAPPVERVSDSAPPVISGNRGLPTTKLNYGAMSSDDRSKLFAELAKAAAEG